MIFAQICRFLSSESCFVLVFCTFAYENQAKRPFVFAYKTRQIDPVRIGGGTPPFFANSFLLTAHARNTPPPGQRGKGAGDRVAGLAGWAGLVAGLAGWAWLGGWAGLAGWSGLVGWAGYGSMGLVAWLVWVYGSKNRFRLVSRTPYGERLISRETTWA